MRSGLLASSQPQASISAAFARQAHVGVGEIPNRFKSLDNSVPGPWVGGGGAGGEDCGKQFLTACGYGIRTPHAEQAAVEAS
jgi:hypothetical protein